MSISHRCHPILVACEWELTEKDIDVSAFLNMTHTEQVVPTTASAAAGTTTPAGSYYSVSVDSTVTTTVNPKTCTLHLLRYIPKP